MASQRNKRKVYRTEPLKEQFKKLKPWHDERWLEQFDELKAFQKHFGHCEIPQKYPVNPTLGYWVAKQGRENKLRLAGEKSSMTDERRSKLNSIGFAWDALFGFVWDASFDPSRLPNDKVVNDTTRFGDNRKRQIVPFGKAQLFPPAAPVPFTTRTSQPSSVSPEITVLANRLGITILQKLEASFNGSNESLMEAKGKVVKQVQETLLPEFLRISDTGIDVDERASIFLQLVDDIWYSYSYNWCTTFGTPMLCFHNIPR